MGLGDFLGNMIGSHTDDVKPIFSPEQMGLNSGIVSQQQGLNNTLKNQLAGNGPSLAALMLNQAQQRNAGTAYGMAAATRGTNPGLAMRNAMNVTANENQNAQQAAGLARAQEQLGAEGALANNLSSMQGQSITAASGANNLNTNIATGNTATNNQVMGGVMNGVSGAMGIGASKAHGGFIRRPSFPQYLSQGGFTGFSELGVEGGDAYGDSKNPYADSFRFSSKGKTPTLPFGGGAGSSTSLAGGPMDAVGGLASDLGPLAMAASKGAVIPGRAPVKGDSKKNDIVPTMLSPDELVIPRSVSMSPSFLKKLSEIVEEMPGKGPQGFAKVLAARKGRA